MSGRHHVTLTVDGLAAIKTKLKGYEEDALETVSDKLRAVGLKMYGEILTRSPVDSGRYRAAWTPPSVQEGNLMVRMRISNTVKHAVPVTYGSEVGKKPWPNPGPKTVRQGNRIYSRQAVGGVVTPVFEGWANDVVREILDSLDKKGLP